MNISRVYIVFFLSIMMLVTSACTGLTQSDKPAISKWWLEPYVAGVQAVPADPSVNVALSVRAVPGLDTDRILTLSDDAQLGQFASARWVDHVPELVASLLERSLQATGRFAIVSESAASRPGNCLLELELREFFADSGANGQTIAVRVSSHGKFQCESAAPVLIQSSISIPVADERMSVIVAAFQQAMDKTTQNILEKIE